MKPRLTFPKHYLVLLVAGWAIFVVPLCLGLYAILKNRAGSARRAALAQQEQVLTKVLERNARFGDLINARSEVLSLGSAFGLKRVFICKGNQEIFGELTAVGCEGAQRRYPLEVTGERLDVGYTWEAAESFHPLIIMSMLATGLLSFVVFLAIAAATYRFLVNTVARVTAKIASGRSAAEVEALDFEIEELRPLGAALRSLHGRIEDNAAKISQLQAEAKFADLAKQVAHDIRSPLSALKIVAAKSSGDPRAELIHSAVQRIDGIASDLLKTSRAAGTFRVSADFLRSFAEIKEREWQGRPPLELKLETGEAPAVRMREHDLFRCLSNLVNNAFEASATEQTVRLSLRCPRDRVEVEVMDRGVGMPAEVLSKLGREQISRGKEDSEHSGHGLGVLSLYRLVESAGGTVHVSSQVGAGTVVTLAFPVIA